MPIKSDPSRWTDPRQRRGLAGERLAMAYLRRQGWQLLAHRFRMRRLEIDLIARRQAVVAFIEVKTRYGDAFGSPFEAVTWSKRREIFRVAQSWISRNGRSGYTYRFDVVGVVFSAGRKRVCHLPDAFRAAR